MRLNRVYVDAALCAGAVIELPTSAGQHLAKVLRARGGEEIVLFSGDGREFAATVESVRGTRVTAAVGQARAVDRESPLAVTLVQCIARADRMDVIVQKATELGVARIVPVLSRRSVVRLDSDQSQSKANHWRAIAASACEQCGRNRLPLIEPPRQLLDYLGAAPPPHPRWVLDPDAQPAGKAEPIRDAAEVAVGPEGGFDAPELDALRLSGFAALKLGPRILRTETAALAALSWLQSRFGDLKGSEDL